MIAGQTNTSTASTVVFDTTVGGSCGGYDNYDGLVGCGVTGVVGSGTGSGSTGVQGTGSSTGVFGYGSSLGVEGSSTDTGGFGSGSTIGVRGTSYLGGIAVWAQNVSSAGVALKADGKVRFSTAVMAVVPSGSKSVTVPLSGIGRGDFALATVQGSGAFYVKNAVIGAGQVTIYINKAPTSPATVTVAYFVISPS